MLTTQQLQTLRAVVDRVIPPDAFPGGWEAGVGDFLLRQLANDSHALLPSYAAWLDGVDAEAVARYGQSFERLESAVQDDTLAAIEAGEVATPWPLDPASFFRIVVEQCAEGFYSDPGNGGNRDGVAWHMIGFEVRG